MVFEKVQSFELVEKDDFGVIGTLILKAVRSSPGQIVDIPLNFYPRCAIGLKQ